MQKNHTIAGWLILLALLSTINYPLSTVRAQGTAFSYQGRLNVNGSPAPNGLYDFQFALWDALSGGAQINVSLTINATGVHHNFVGFVILQLPPKTIE